MDKKYFGIPVHFEKTNETIEDDKLIQLRVWIANVGENHNASYFSKETLTKMAESLPLTPVTGYIGKNAYNEKDFRAHEEELIRLGKDEYEFNYLGFAYGFVPQDPEWKFEMKMCPDQIEREYLCCNIMVWKKWKEVIDIFERDNWSKKQSMELVNCDGFINEDDNLFHFTSASFDALCILGNDIEPGIPFSNIERASFMRFNKQIKSMLQEYTIFQKVQSENKINNTNNSDDINTETIVDNQMFNNINKKEGEVMPLSKKEIATKFSLTASQLFDEFSRVLGEVTYEGEDYWGDTVQRSKYYLRDYDENFAYVVDCQNDYMDMKIPYATEGDNIKLDYTSASRIKYAPVDWEGGVEDDPDYIDVVQDFAKKIVSEAKERIAKIESDFATEKEQFTSELSAKDATISEKEDAILSFDAKIQAINDESKAKDATIETLTQFKKKHDETIRKEKVEALFTKFSRHFSKEEMEDFRNRESEFAEFEVFEKEVKSFACDRLVESVKEGKTEFSNMAIVDNNLPENKTEDEPKDVFSKLEAKLKK